MNHWTAPDSHKHPFSTKSSSPLSPTPRRKPAAHTSLSILTASVCVKNAVPLTFLMYWPLLPVKPLFLKGMLLWAKPWNIHWHRLQDRFHKETAKAIQSYAALQALLVHPAPLTALMIKCGSGEETKPRCKGKRHSQRWGNQLVQREAFHLPMVWSFVLKWCHTNPSYPSWIPLLGYCHFYHW